MTIKSKTDLLTLDLSFGGVPFANILAKDAADTEGSLDLSFGGVPFFGVGTGDTNVSVSPLGGTLNIVGYAPTVTQTGNLALVPSEGVLGVFGYAPTLTQTAHQAVAPAGGVLSVFGYAPTVSQSLSQFIAPSGGALSIFGYAPIVSQTEFKGDWIVVLEITVPVTAGSPTSRVFYFSERAMVTSAFDTPPNTEFREVTLNAADLKRDIPLSTRAAGLVSASFGNAIFDNTEGQHDDWIDYGTHGGTVVARIGPWRGAYPSTFFHVYTARIEGSPLVDFTQMELNLRGSDYLFDRQVVTEGFDGSGALEGTGAAGTNRRRMIFGTCWITPVLIDEVNNVFHLNANSRDGITKLFNGGNFLEHDAAFDAAAEDLYGLQGPEWIWTVPTPVPGEWGQATALSGETYAFLGTAPDIELRAQVVGDPWAITDLAAHMGLTVTPDDQLNLVADFGLGNRIVDTQTAAQVLVDVAKFEVAVIGNDRLDRFFARYLTPSSAADTFAYTFNESNSKNWKIIQAASGKRVWRVNVRAFPHRKSRLAGEIADDSYLEDDAFDTDSRDEITAAKPYLVREPYMTQFSASSASVLAADPGAEEITVTIDSDSFPTTAVMLAWARRFLKVFGARQIGLTLETDFNPGVASLELTDKVRFSHSRFNSASRACRVSGIVLKLLPRIMEFTLWSHDDVPDDIVVDFTDLDPAAAGNGAAVGINTQPGVPDGRDFSIPLGDETSVITAGTFKRVWYVPFDFRLEEVAAFLKTAQTSGSIYTVDIQVDSEGSPGLSSIFSTKLTIDNNERTSLTAATPNVLRTRLLRKGQRVVFNVDQIGNGTAIGPSVSLTGFRV
jgi:hypothetical protein